jgi:hypothetical protein
MEGALRDRPIEDAQAKDDQQRESPSNYQQAHALSSPTVGGARRPFRTGKPIMSPPGSMSPSRCRSETSFFTTSADLVTQS